MSLEEQAQIQNGLAQRACDAQQERSQEAAKATIAVQEWVNGFELDMHESGFDQKRKVWMIRVQEFLERVEALHQTIRGRRHERSVPRPCATDPILSGAEFPRLFAAA